MMYDWYEPPGRRMLIAITKQANPRDVGLFISSSSHHSSCAPCCCMFLTAALLIEGSLLLHAFD